MSTKPKAPQDKKQKVRNTKSEEKTLSTEADSSHQSTDKLTKSQQRLATIQ